MLKNTTKNQFWTMNVIPKGNWFELRYHQKKHVLKYEKNQQYDFLLNNIINSMAKKGLCLWNQVTAIWITTFWNTHANHDVKWLCDVCLKEQLQHTLSTGWEFLQQ